MKTKLLLCLFIFSFFYANAKKAPIKFGKIELSDLEMTTYEKDSSASAVVLCDYGYFNGTELEFTRIVRIKILKKEGYAWADRVFPTSEKATIRGITYNLENGEIVKEKLSKKSIFSDRITQSYYNMRVAMPNVKVGSVIDIQFTHPFLPNEWEFQKSIPVIHSELTIESNDYISFKKTFFGYEQLAVSTNGFWVAKDMPAFKKEPYVNSMDNYITKMEFNISNISIPGYFYKSTSSWSDISKILYDSDKFGIVMKNSRYLKTLAEIIKRRELSEIETIKEAHKEIKNAIKWNDNNNLHTSVLSLNKVYKEKIGNSADINIALIQLLKLLDYDAEPIILSTRKNGMISPSGPNINKINYVIVGVKIGEDRILLDATEEYMPFDILPKKCLNGSGQIITKAKTAYIPLTAKKKDKQYFAYTVSMDEDLNLVGKLQSRKYEYAAFDFRKKYNSFNSKEEFINDFVNDNNGIEVQESSFDYIDDINQPVTEKYEVKLANYVTKIGDEYYLNPMLTEAMLENPFKTNERLYPIDYAYKQSKTVIVNIQLPTNLQVVEIPKSVKMKLGENDGSFTYQIGIKNNLLNLKFSYSINKEVFIPTEYPNLKEFYNQIIAKHAEPIILKMNNEI